MKTVIKGTGAAVKENQTVLAHYTGKIWGTDKQFDSSWERGSPRAGPRASPACRSAAAS